VRIFDLISRYWALVGGLTAAGVLSGLALAFLLTPSYRAESVLAPVPDPDRMPGIEALGGQLGGVAGLLGINGLGESRTQEYLAVLRSRALTNKFIEQNDLIPLLFEKRYERAGAGWALRDGEEEPSLEDAYRRVNEDVRHVSESSQTGLITVAVDWRDPEIASRWANDLVGLANSEIRRQAIDLAQKSISFLNEELERANVVELRQSIYQLIEAQIQNIMIANVREEYAFRVIDPAVAPDLDDPQSPNRPLLVVLFSGIGLMAGLLVASFLDIRRSAGAFDRPKSA